ncbi:hypothetical protein [Herbaspirillum camelliae]|uniref:hypothetical protein n=1 Tax=Herbaspirillum camelliae TaxID=1892903 RepID=UPI0018E95F0D|nr:hypothetical protein [Herbaspirillum camelliae]
MGQAIRHEVLTWGGVPVCGGIGATKKSHWTSRREQSSKTLDDQHSESRVQRRRWRMGGGKHIVPWRGSFIVPALSRRRSTQRQNGCTEM